MLWEQECCRWHKWRSRFNQGCVLQWLDLPLLSMQHRPPFPPLVLAQQSQAEALSLTAAWCVLSRCRQLSEENANLQEYVEKETQEKKRLSRTNEELLWKLQTGDPTSPVKLSPTSPIYRSSSSGPSSPAKVSSTPR